MLSCDALCCPFHITLVISSPCIPTFLSQQNQWRLFSPVDSVKGIKADDALIRFWGLCSPRGFLDLVNFLLSFLYVCSVVAEWWG